MKIRAEPNEPEDIGPFSGIPWQDFGFLLIPMQTYRRIAEVAKQQGCTVGTVFERALLQYLRSAEEGDSNQSAQEEEESAPRRRPDIVVRRRRR